MRKIVQVLPALGWGGAQVFCIQLCNQLVQAGCQVTLVSMYHHKPGKHLPLDMLDKRIQFITLGKHKGFDAGMFVKLWKLMQRLQPDVVHTHLHAGYYCFLGYLRIKRFYKKIHTFHNLVKRDAPWMGRKAYSFFFNKNIIVPVSISEEVFKGAKEEYGDSIQVLIPNGSDAVKPTVLFAETAQKINALKKNADTKVLVNVARISAQKNQQLLQACMQRLSSENVICIVIGDYVAGDKKIYDALIAGKPVNVFYIGKVSNVGDYLLNADAFVLSSVFEGLPISLLEALSAKVVPVCTPVGGLKDVVKDDIGILSASVSEEDFLAAIKTFLNAGQQQVEKYKNNGKALFEKTYSMQSCAKKYEAVYFGK